MIINTRLIHEQAKLNYFLIKEAFFHQKMCQFQDFPYSLATKTYLVFLKKINDKGLVLAYKDGYLGYINIILQYK